jgi:hypothetical protein
MNGQRRFREREFNKKLTKKRYIKPSVIPLCDSSVSNAPCIPGASPGIECVFGSTPSILMQCLDGAGAGLCRCAVGNAGSVTDPCATGMGGVCKI